jgi:hypothetical protein
LLPTIVVEVVGTVRVIVVVVGIAARLNWSCFVVSIVFSSIKAESAITNLLLLFTTTLPEKTPEKVPKILKCTGDGKL